MTFDQNNTAQINFKTTDRKVDGKKDQRNFANRHADGKAFEWLMSIKEIPQTGTNHTAA